MNSTAGRPADGRTGRVGAAAETHRCVAKVAVMVLLLTVGPSARRPAVAQDADHGKTVYTKWCAGCHGEDGKGDGDGATFMLPRPRDFTRGVYQVRTTPNGELPTDADLLHVVEVGMPGTAMPGWQSRLSDQERRDVVAYVKSFSRFFQDANPTPVDFGKPPKTTAETIADGEQIFEKLECFKCHGNRGRGDGKSAPTLKDDWDHPIRAANLTEGWNFNGGGEVEQIYRRLRTGLDGTPMPSFNDVLESKVITDDQLWHVAQYVRSLTPDRPPVREVIRAVRVEGTLPTAPDDSLWATADPAFVPLVGQVVIKPRWFAPRVDGIWVRALHDGQTLTMLVSWSDPSASPDSAWQEWANRMASTMPDVDGAVSPDQGPDRLHVQFPLRRSDGVERPYFLGGDTRRPTYQWQWTSTPDAVAEGRASGLGSFTPAAGGDVRHAARFADGEWRVVFTRPLVPADTAAAPTFPVGEAIPIAFFAADGSNGEVGVRGSVSAWYAIYLDVPTPGRVYVLPVITTLVTAGLGGLVVVRAQRRATAA
jgi:DMSO reductase family type II enzyme heme b subunit